METMVATALVTLVIGTLLILSSATGRSLAEMVNYVDLDHYNRIAMDTMTREVRQVQRLTNHNSTTLTFVDHDGNLLRYRYSPTERELVRQRLKASDGSVLEEKVLLEECDELAFGVFQRTPQAKTDALIPASTPAQCKVVTVTWSCSRKIFGFKANTEQGQTAKIVIRNKKEI